MKLLAVINGRSQLNHFLFIIFFFLQTMLRMFQIVPAHVDLETQWIAQFHGHFHTRQ